VSFGPRHGIEPVAAEGMTPGEPPQAEPAAADDPMNNDRIAHVVGTRRLESARAGKER
jgi:hypothetical protein